MFVDSGLNLTIEDCSVSGGRKFFSLFEGTHVVHKNVKLPFKIGGKFLIDDWSDVYLCGMICHGLYLTSISI